MKRKTKKVLAWIGGGLLAGLSSIAGVLSFVFGSVASFGKFLVGCFAAILSVLSVQIAFPLWTGLLAITLIGSIWLYEKKRLSLRKLEGPESPEEKTTIPDVGFLSYNNDSYFDINNHFRNWDLKWEYVKKSDGRYLLRNIHPYCKICNCDLDVRSSGSSSGGSKRDWLQCPACGKRFEPFYGTDNLSAEKVLRAKIQKEYQDVPSTF
jgi:hypothetical protein